ncbi:hypothetical protein [Bacillus sp. EB01]|uniref:hypothetical protein n=1 Tax=Bacillus sp. EB01 TaxID=1347086 RepID=UPI0005C4A453|nr:hypothetical protein [Bacillus sp. EB01]
MIPEDQLKKMLEELCYYKEVEITHTFSQNEKPVLTVSCITQENFHAYQITYLESASVKVFTDVNLAVNTILEVLNSNLEPSTN